MLKRVSFIVALMNSLVTGNCNETESNSQTSIRLESLAAILNDLDNTAIDLPMQRVYVDPHKISINDQGIITYETSKKIIILPELYSSQQGCFVKCSERDLEILSNNDDIRIWWCPSCKAFRSMDRYNRCTRCGRKL